MNAGDPGVETWPSLEAARHGGAQPWVPGAYDPETHLYIFGTGNPTPAYTPAGRGVGVGLFTCSLVAVNVDTGQDGVVLPDVAARHARLGLGANADSDRHDDRRPSTQARVDRRAQRLFLHGRSDHRRARCQRASTAWPRTGRAGSTRRAGRSSIPRRSRPIPGAIVSGSATNWPPPAYSPDTGLFYVPENNNLSIAYLIDADPRGSMGLGGVQGGGGVTPAIS